MGNLASLNQCKTAENKDLNYHSRQNQASIFCTWKTVQLVNILSSLSKFGSQVIKVVNALNIYHKLSISLFHAFHTNALNI